MSRAVIPKRKGGMPGIPRRIAFHDVRENPSKSEVMQRQKPDTDTAQITEADLTV